MEIDAFALVAIIGVVVLSIMHYRLYKKISLQSGEKLAVIKEGEENVTTKIIDNKQYMLNEKGETLDLKRISN